ncbi:Small-conductance mechanosensitive channel [Candidatus Phaeomarinobacter ectocarpi]|uniref:Small-conductance mechanosensitive channel n=1 Tax=Candidatus Phaeomarinibacter ectocarpi TaxID=1458461 RepID=X5MCZ5_9HYPH|nr:mechanosensitive ion channel family protein [Candidatus Phaeomarinobacter ectocarpi]CDO59697.1 Small-conductance mechanosensitive channel [Candidatus Phaeomarinobacter ectocarpi]
MGDIQPIDILITNILDMVRGLIALLPQIGLAIVILIITWAISKLANKLVHRALPSSRMRPSLVELMSNLLSIGIWVVGLVVAAIVVFPTITPGDMIAALGIGSLAIGFAFKDIFENFMAGILILYRRPMRIGDYMECDGVEGRVEKISIRDTHVRRTDGQLVVMPNGMLFRNPVEIRTDRDIRRVTISAGVAYDEDVDQSRDVITKAVEACKTVRTNEPVQVFAEAFGASSIDFEVTWWTGSKPVDVRKSRDEVVASVKRALDEAGIEIPFPYRTLTFKEPLTLKQEAATDTGSASGSDGG